MRHSIPWNNLWWCLLDRCCNIFINNWLFLLNLSFNLLYLLNQIFNNFFMICFIIMINTLWIIELMENNEFIGWNRHIKVFWISKRQALVGRTPVLKGIFNNTANWASTVFHDLSKVNLHNLLFFRRRLYLFFLNYLSFLYFLIF